jgi:hypothetical protein
MSIYIQNLTGLSISEPPAYTVYVTGGVYIPMINTLCIESQYSRLYKLLLSSSYAKTQPLTRLPELPFPMRPALTPQLRMTPNQTDATVCLQYTRGSDVPIVQPLLAIFLEQYSAGVEISQHQEVMIPKLTETRNH